MELMHDENSSPSSTPTCVPPGSSFVAFSGSGNFSDNRSCVVVGNEVGECPFALQGLPCRPCKWFYKGTCKAGKDCKFCHIHQFDNTDKKDRRARKDQRALEEMLPDAETRSLLEYEHMAFSALGEQATGAKVLCHELRQAYVAHMSEKKGRIEKAKLLVEKTVGFCNRSTDGFFRSQRESSLWHEPPENVKVLHDALIKRICEAGSSDVVNGWFSVIDDMTRLMSCLTEATRGPSENDAEELEELCYELESLLADSETHVEVKNRLQAMFGSF